MTYNEIMALLDKGFTPEYIMCMGQVDNNIINVNEEEDQEPDSPPQENPNNHESEFQAMMAAFNERMDAVVKEIQASNILASQQKHVEKSADPAVDAMAQLLMPPGLADKK